MFTNKPPEAQEDIHPPLPPGANGGPIGLGAMDLQNREIAEVYVMMLAAANAPRDEGEALRKIRLECQNVELIKSFEYVYVRGGTEVQGPSIELLRVIATHWGRTDYGFRYLRETPEEAELQAYAVDLQNMNRRTLQFVIKKFRETKDGGYPITSQRDANEFVTGQAMRRVRACLSYILPKRIVDDAITWCNEAAVQMIGSKEDAVNTIIGEFEVIGVEEHALEQRLGRKIRSAKLSQLIKMHKVHTAIVDGITSVTEEFPGTRTRAPAKRRLATANRPPSVQEESIQVDPRHYPDVPSDARRLPSWPPGLHASKERKQWYDAAGTIFDRAEHGWNSVDKHPSMRSDGRFRPRRGTASSSPSSADPAADPTADATPDTPPQQDPDPDPKPAGWTPGQQNDYADASGR